MLKPLFDFDTFHFPKLVRVIFTIAVVLIALATVAAVFDGLGSIRYGFFRGIGRAIFALVGGAVGIALARIFTELTLVFFAINENLKAIRDAASKS